MKIKQAKYKDCIHGFFDIFLIKKQILRLYKQQIRKGIWENKA